MFSNVTYRLLPALIAVLVSGLLFSGLLIPAVPVAPVDAAPAQSPPAGSRAFGAPMQRSLTRTAVRETALARTALRQTTVVGRRTAVRETALARTALRRTTVAGRRTATAELRATRTAAAQAATATATPTATVPPADMSVPVTRVVDGDTFVVLLDGTAVTVRLLGVDTPESVDPRQPVQCFGREAAARTRTLIDGVTVQLEFDATQGTYDRYGRLLAHVRLPSGELLGHELIRSGYAFEYTYRLPHRYQTLYRAAQQAARTAAVGLWAPETCNGVVSNSPTPTAAPFRCPTTVDAAAAGESPLSITALDKVAERITLRNTGSDTIELSAWRICSLRGAQRHSPLSGSLAPGESRSFVHAGAAIWNNTETDPAALFAPDGTLISYWPDR